jgi:fatty-acyl-CoA synthase
MRCDLGEPGEAISPMAGHHFDGYTDPVASDKKVLRDVFQKDDRWFRSGDLMRKDPDGYYYFIDRLGDTFRWKGENVSTTEVASVVCGAAGVIDAVVYGVSVPGNEGRAGMAAISTTDEFSFPALSDHLKQQLPDYARPMFVRRCASLDATGTFKLIKADLARDGFMDSSDPVWAWDHRTEQFHRFCQPSRQQVQFILCGEVSVTRRSGC